MRYLFFLLSALLITSCSFEDEDSELCFVGDSITFLWDVESYFPTFVTHSHAVGGATIEALDKWDLSDCNGIPTVFLMGTNNIGKISVDDKNAAQRRIDFANALIPRLERIGANPLIYVSILPRNSQWKQESGVNKNIDLQNALVVEKLDSVDVPFKYVNAFDAFLDSNYEIKKSLYTDGVHLSVEGYEVLTDLVQGKL